MNNVEEFFKIYNIGNLLLDGHIDKSGYCFQIYHKYYNFHLSYRYNERWVLYNLNSLEKFLNGCLLKIQFLRNEINKPDNKNCYDKE